jgi:A nuclease family of the HNH/ENDO VII superfamily with conserved AHH
VPISFSRVNKLGSPGYRSGWQRHHILPRALANRPQFRRLFENALAAGLDLDDFETNGLLLPCCDEAARDSGRPLHCGPHPRYDDLVCAWVEMIRREHHEGLVQPSTPSGSQLRHLQMGIRKWLTGDGGSVPHSLGCRDPFADHAHNAALDDVVDVWIGSIRN